MCTVTLSDVYICRSIMSDIDRDSRVLSLVNRPGLRQSLVTILDQLGRCQKALNEFLEVHTTHSPQLKYLSLFLSLTGEASSVSEVLFLGR